MAHKNFFFKIVSAVFLRCLACHRRKRLSVFSKDLSPNPKSSFLSNSEHRNNHACGVTVRRHGIIRAIVVTLDVVDWHFNTVRNFIG